MRGRAWPGLAWALTGLVSAMGMVRIVARRGLMAIAAAGVVALSEL
jgi:hypothetical protein